MPRKRYFDGHAQTHRMIWRARQLSNSLVDSYCNPDGAKSETYIPPRYFVWTSPEILPAAQAVARSRFGAENHARPKPYDAQQKRGLVKSRNISRHAGRNSRGIGSRCRVGMLITGALLLSANRRRFRYTGHLTIISRWAHVWQSRRLILKIGFRSNFSARKRLSPPTERICVRVD